MHIYEKIISETEDMFSEKNHKIVDQIIKKVEDYYHVHFSFPASCKKATQKLHLLLLLPQYQQYYPFLVSCLQEQQMNQSSLLFDLLGLLFQVHMTQEEKNLVESAIQKFPFDFELEKDKRGYQVHLETGTLRLYRGLDVIQKEKSRFLLKNYLIRGMCHFVVSEVASEYANDYLTVSEIPHCFEGSFLHSYITLKDRGVLDLSNNIYYEEDGFERLYQPNELLKLEGRKYFYSLEKLDQTIGRPTEEWPGVLCLALEKKRRRM